MAELLLDIGLGLKVQAFLEKCKILCELSQSNALLSELYKCALYRAREKCIFRAPCMSEKKCILWGIVMTFEANTMRHWINTTVSGDNIVVF